MGVYCFNGKAVFIMTDQRNDVGYLDLFTYVQFFGICMFNGINVSKCKNDQILFYCVT